MFPRFVRVAMATGVAVLVVAACSSTPSSPQVASAGGGGGAGTTTASAPTNPAQAWHEWGVCMRAHGAQVSDPTLDARNVPQLDKTQLNAIMGRTMTEASQACRSIIDNVPGNPANPGTGSIETKVTFARCMRAHGVPDFPDPDPTTGALNLTNAIHSEPAFQSAEQTCRASTGGR